jgi:tRNA1(Val) A37 N6-methylase TrmN6
MTKTLDSFLGGKIKLFQPSAGYRAGIDPIFLAASVQPQPQDKVLDVGAGVGAASLALAARCPEIKITCLEMQADMVDLALKNVQSNNLIGSVEVILGDILSPPKSLLPYSFDHVMTNPPYHEHDRSQSSPIPGKAQAMIETMDLAKWMDFCLKMLKPKGVFTMIHRTERLREILGHLEKKMGNLVIYPLWAGPDKPARRVIIQGHKGKKGELSLLSGMVLHRGDEKYTPEAESILRDAQKLTL